MQYLSNLNTAVSPCKDKTSQDKPTGVHARIHIPKGTYVYFVTYKGDDTVVSLSAGSIY